MDGILTLLRSLEVLLLISGDPGFHSINIKSNVMWKQLLIFTPANKMQITMLWVQTVLLKVGHHSEYLPVNILIVSTTGPVIHFQLG